MYKKMREGLLKYSESGSDTRFHILSDPTYVLLNVWDIGVSKALHEALPLLARLTQPLVLLNLLNLSRDFGKNLREKPEQKKIHEEQSVMIGRSRAHYYMRIAGLCKSKGSFSILIGTHKDKVDPGDLVERVKQLEAVFQAKAGDMGVESLHHEMLAIDVNNREDYGHVKRCLEDLVSSNQEFNKDLRLTWIFLRTALIGYKSESDFRMSRDEFDCLAQQCGLKTKKEIDECLEFFTVVGSLLYHSLYFHGNVIYNPFIFFQKLNVLYCTTDKQKSQHAQESLKKGILCKTVAAELWDIKSGDKDFFWNLLQDSGVAALTCYLDFECPYQECNERDCLFVSSLRKERLRRSDPKVMKPDSVYITFNAQYVPGDIQALFVKYIPSYLPGVQLNTREFYNITEFELPENRGSFKIVSHGDVVEIITDEKIQERVEMMSVLKTLCVTILDLALKYFPGFEYRLGFLCPKIEIKKESPPNKSKITYLYFLPSQHETHLFCRRCKVFHELTDGQKKWMKAFLTDAATNVSFKEYYEARAMSENELMKITKLIPLEYYEQICNLQQSSPQTFSEESVLAVLVNWQKESQSNRREKLARILMNMGCYKAALKLDAKLLIVHEEVARPVTSKEVLSEKELEIICNLAVDWRKLATALNISQEMVLKIEKTSDRERDCCRRVLKGVSITRTQLAEKLDLMGWYSLAESLRCGCIHR